MQNFIWKYFLDLNQTLGPWFVFVFLALESFELWSLVIREDTRVSRAKCVCVFACIEQRPGLQRSRAVVGL